jgi:hypothetical protein
MVHQVLWASNEWRDLGLELERVRRATLPADGRSEVPVDDQKRSKSASSAELFAKLEAELKKGGAS